MKLAFNDALRTLPAMRPTGDLARIDTWVFDLDNTLYPATCDLLASMERRMSTYIAELLGVNEAEALRLRQALSAAHGTTLRGLMEEHRLAPDEFLAYVHEIDLSLLAQNGALDAALTALPGRKVIFTNATERHAANVLGRLGVAHHFTEIFDVSAAGYLPKPKPEAYASFVRRHAIPCASAAMLEDMARNLEPAFALGMTTVWVRNDRPNAQMAADCRFVHHVAEDLVAWLEGAAPGQQP